MLLALLQAEASRAEKSPNKVDAVDLSPSRMELRRLGELPVYEFAAHLF